MIIIKSIKRHERDIVAICHCNSPCITTMNFFSLWLLKLFLLDLVPFVAKLMDNWL